MMTASDIPELDKSGLRQFGITTGSIVAVLFGLLIPWLFDLGRPVWPWAVFAVLVSWGLIAPRTLRPVYRGWMRFGLVMSRIVTPVIMTILFAVTIIPSAAILRILRKDFMKRRFDDSDSYRVESKQPSVDNLEKPY